MTSFALSVAVFLTLLISVCGQQADTDIKEWYSYARSPEAVASANANLELNRLPPDERTLEAAVQLCHKQNGDNFCAWIAVDGPTDKDRAVAVSCFNELHRQCNRRSPKLLVNGSTPRKFRDADCELCSPCIDAKWDSYQNLRRVCYCTCDHYRSSFGSDYSGRSSREQIFQCHEFCDGTKQCGNYNDERTDSCSYYKLAGDPQPIIASPSAAEILMASCVLLFIIGGVCGGMIFCRYRRYQNMLLPPQQSIVMVSIAAPLPPTSYPHQVPLLPPQPQPQPHVVTGMPPPPPYSVT